MAMSPLVTFFFVCLFVFRFFFLFLVSKKKWKKKKKNIKNRLFEKLLFFFYYIKIPSLKKKKSKTNNKMLSEKNQTFRWLYTLDLECELASENPSYYNDERLLLLCNQPQEVAAASVPPKQKMLKTLVQIYLDERTALGDRDFALITYRGQRVGALYLEKWKFDQILLVTYMGPGLSAVLQYKMQQLFKTTEILQKVEHDGYGIVGVDIKRHHVTQHLPLSLSVDDIKRHHINQYLPPSLSADDDDSKNTADAAVMAMLEFWREKRQNYQKANVELPWNFADPTIPIIPTQDSTAHNNCNIM